MGRAEKLFRRLDELESEFKKLATAELEAFLQDGWSQILSRVYSATFRGKYWQTEECGEFEWLEKEIEVLRVKLEQPLSESAVGQLRRLLQQLHEEQTKGTGIEFRIIKELLRQWECGSPRKK